MHSGHFNSVHPVKKTSAFRPEAAPSVSQNSIKPNQTGSNQKTYRANLKTGLG
jgi:hypothetical protein